MKLKSRATGESTTHTHKRAGAQIQDLQEHETTLANPGAEQTSAQGNLLIEQPKILAALNRIVAGKTTDPELRKDMMQEALLHLWRMEWGRPGQTISWYLQSCRFCLGDCLKHGRSVDSPRHRFVRELIDSQTGSIEAHTPQLESGCSLFADVCARDLLNELYRRLHPTEQIVLALLVEERGRREIVELTHFCQGTVAKSCRMIRAEMRQLHAQA